MGQMKKYLKITAAVIMMAVLCVKQTFPVRAWDEVITCTALGDSIAKGYSSDKVIKIKSYSRIVTERLAEENEAYFNYMNYAKSGLNTQELNDQILSRDTVKRSLNQSDIILLTMGSNDLLDEFKKEAQEILNTDTKFRSANQALGELTEGVKKNPLIVLKIVDALSNWDYGRFENEWLKAMDTIMQQKKDSAQIIVTNIYNPVYNMDLPGTLNKVVENIIKNMNGIIEKRAEEYGYQVVDLFHSNIAAFVQGDGLHPSQEGQQLIADLVYKNIKDPFMQMGNSQSVDGEAVKGEELENRQSELAENRPDTEIPEERKTEESQGNQDENTDAGLLSEYFAVGFSFIAITVAGMLYGIKRRRKG